MTTVTPQKTMAQLIQETKDATIWFGGWGGVTCGWQREECLTESTREEHADMVARGDTILSLDDYLQNIIGEGVWPRSIFEIGDHFDELDMKCDHCGREVRALIAEAVEPPPSLHEWEVDVTVRVQATDADHARTVAAQRYGVPATYRARRTDAA